MMIIMMCATINLYQAKTGQAAKNISFAFAVCFAALLFVYTVTLLIVLSRNYDKLESDPIKN